MQINILGPLEAEIDGVSVVPSATKPRKVLALLAARMNTITPISQLMQEVWDEEAPVSASTTMQTYILQLRKLIANARPNDPVSAKRILVTMSGGYMLSGPADALDQHRYEQLVRHGHAALRVDDSVQAALLFRQALGMWRGTSLVDVEQGRPLQAHVIRLEESRLHVQELCIEAELRLGHHQMLLSELAALTVEHRFSENIRAQFMLALYRSGRCAHALETFRQFRALMVEEIGLEPSARMYRLHQAILGSDPSLDEWQSSPDSLLALGAA
ncbi:BTAD domain-containing putative transcriptional regulator [Kitasatospora sp. NPDC056446]|uniref:AfsR/SARP family transcriptional regulator n=1 Tax=Kitasatospora sp. NPDC056446 TaxID=3345819 RepID=UPI003688D237